VINVASFLCPSSKDFAASRMSIPEDQSLVTKQ
jgi:hypothetical protein